MDKTKRAVGYIRVSDDSQAEQDRASLPEQERSIREYCERQGYELIKVFSDIGRRWNANRLQFQQMISKGKENPRPYDVIVVWRADRIVGSASTVAALEPLFDQKGIDIEGVTEPVHKEWLLLNAIIAKGETEAKKERGKLAIKTAIERGHLPGHTPYGRKRDKDTGKIVLDEEEAYWYREMFNWYIGGDGIVKIAKRLNSLRVPTRLQGMVDKHGRVLGRGWVNSQVATLLTDTAAYGEDTFQIKNGVKLIFKLPPVIDRETFERARKVSNSRQHFGQKTTNREYLISPRKGRCSECGQRFHLQSRARLVKKRNANGEITTYARYSLSPLLICWGMNKYPHIYKCREHPYIDFDLVQSSVLRKLGEVLGSDDFAFSCCHPDNNQVEKTAKELKEAHDALDQTNKEINFVVTQGRKGIIPESVFNLQMSQLKEVLEYRQKRVGELEIEYKDADNKIRKIDQILPFIEPMKEFWSLFKQATINNNRISIGSAGSTGSSREINLPISLDNFKKLQDMLDVLFESFTIDRDNKVTVQLSIPVLEGIHKEAECCRQLIPSPCEREKLEKHRLLRFAHNDSETGILYLVSGHLTLFRI